MSTGTGLATPKVFRNLPTADPFRILGERLNRLFEDGIITFAPQAYESFPLSSWAPACDVYETDKEIVVKAELPEVKKESVQVTFDQNVLTIRGERKFEEEIERKNHHRVERSYGEFMRSFTLPAFVDPTQINAEFNEGMLRVTIPKREAAKPKQVEIKTN
jgi:HSP20 family protein